MIPYVQLNSYIYFECRERESTGPETRVLATFLSEMDGIGGTSEGVIVLGATNRVDSIDAALIRKVFYFILHYFFLQYDVKIFYLGEISPSGGC